MKTREEQIFDIASQYSINETDGQNNGKAASKRGLLLCAFRDGAKWADQHPQMKPENKLQDFKKEVEGLRNISDADEYAKQLAHLFLGNGLSLQTILLMAIDFGQQHPHWIRVEEMLPKVGEPVWFYTPSMDEPLKGAYQENGTWYSVEYECKFINGVTHWTKVQPPRKEDKE